MNLGRQITRNLRIGKRGREVEHIRRLSFYPRWGGACQNWVFCRGLHSCRCGGVLPRAEISQGELPHAGPPRQSEVGTHFIGIALIAKCFITAKSR